MVLRTLYIALSQAGPYKRTTCTIAHARNRTCVTCGRCNPPYLFLFSSRMPRQRHISYVTAVIPLFRDV